MVLTSPGLNSQWRRLPVHPEDQLALEPGLTGVGRRLAVAAIAGLVRVFFSPDRKADAMACELARRARRVIVLRLLLKARLPKSLNVRRANTGVSFNPSRCATGRAGQASGCARAMWSSAGSWLRLTRIWTVKACVG